MSTVKTIYKNVVFLTGAEIISKILQFFLIVYAARVLDKGSFGKFNFALSLSFIALVLADFGINSLLIREVARNRKSVGKFFVNAAFSKFLLSIGAFAAVAVFFSFMDYPDETKKVVYIMWIFNLVSTFTELFYSIFRAFESMIFDSIVKVVRMFILTGMGMLVLSKYGSVALFCACFVATELIVLLLAYSIASKKFQVNKGSIDKEFIKTMIRKAMPFGLSFVFSTIYFYISSVILATLKGDVEVANFSSAFNIVLAVLFISNVYGNVIYPVMSRYFKTSKESLKLIYGKSFKYLVIIGVPISVGLYVLSKDVMFFLYKDKYLAAYVALQIIAGYIFIKFVNTLIGVLLSSIDKQGHRMACQGVTAVTIIILNLILIPKMGFVGAAAATFAAEVVLFAMYYFYALRFSYAYNFIPILLKSLGAALIMSGLVVYLDIGLIPGIILGGILYFAAIILFKGLDHDDIGIIRTILKKDNKI